MITLNHYLFPSSGAQASTVTRDGRNSTVAEEIPIGLLANLAIHIRPNGKTDADPDFGETDVSGWSWRFSFAADWNPATPPLYLSTHVTHPSAGLWVVDLSALSTRTCETVLATAALGRIDVGCELAGVPDGGSWAAPGFLLQWTAPIVGRRDSGASATPMPDDPISGDALDVIRAALASVPSATPTTASETANRVAAVVEALKNLSY